MPKAETSTKLVYSKTALVKLVISDAKPDWGKIAQSIGKTKMQVYDTWRKSLLKALVSNQPWSSSGGADGKKDRIAILSAVVDTVKPDWTVLAKKFEGKTKTRE
ncbi:uncharacterized protein MKK02DRAFT_42764 [Dioszegia hungarica]|uniref:Myb-like domain-containing protein n=1 Tax=Dioszegia hungarica TaxID=4972 RepID=A0AA38HE72_9TREE|nr:uncharacterized protein MKK02DRAFT_42764 [Dioszegia hungarica]KAI9638377.1 hypothetical protein MKK02DRAFT_42764 [Dioszegia hungarica]